MRGAFLAHLCFHSSFHAVITHLLFPFTPLYPLFFRGLIRSEKQVPWKEAHSNALSRSFSICPNSLPPLLSELLLRGQHLRRLLWKPSIIPSIRVGAPPLCPHTPLLPSVTTSITLDQNGPSTCLSSP